jgi:DNA-binding NtrC family response regulator
VTSAAASSLHSRAVSASRRTVLVVDDDESLRLLCRVNLELEGHRVVEASTLATARAALVEERPDVVLLDLHVGSEHGIDLLAELPRDGPRVVLFTGTAEISPELRARVDAIVPKPFDLEQLATAVAPDGA